MRQLAALVLIVAAFTLSVNLTRATCNTEEECQQQIIQQNSQLTSIQKQQAELQRQLDAAKRGLSATTAQLNEMQKQVDAINAELAKAEDDLKNAQAILDQNKALFASRVRDLYVQGAASGWELLFGSSYSFTEAAQFVGLKQAVINKNRDLITQYTETVNNLDTARDAVAESQRVATDQLAQIKALRDSQSAQVSSIQKNYSALNSQLAQINASIKNLTVRQQEILAAKLAATQQGSSLGGSAPPTTNLPPAPFSPSFTFLTYGYPHRIGMNQYGALGRARAGQNFQTILSAYYRLTATPANVPATIRVNGCNEMGQCFSNQVFDFEDYVKHLYEMPSSWPAEALKAQAVAARTYAFRYGSPICPSQSCQVVKKEINSAAWQQAVEATRGLVLGGNNPIAAYYSSTDGGYTCTSFTAVDPCSTYLVDVSSGSAWSGSTAWDGPSHGNSPWFHKGWGDRAGGGDYNPWLSAEETADMFNAVTLSKKSSSYNQFLSPIDKGGWSMAQVRAKLQELGGPVIDVATAVGYGFDGRGNTSAVSVVGANGQAFSVAGKDFRAMFNLRSRGTLAIWTSFFDVLRAN